LRNAAAGALLGAPHPAIPLPRDLYGAVRRNSSGLDLADESTLAALAAACIESAALHWRAAPLVDGHAQTRAVPPVYGGARSDTALLIAGGARSDAMPRVDGGAHTDAMPLPVTDPGDRRSVVGAVVEASAADVAAALDAAECACPAWQATPAAERAAALERAADLMQQRMPILIGLIVREAGKTFANAVGEVRESIDFMRYYAAQARRELRGERRPLGIVACISPWNFPLAIFTGQVAAALAAGNAVIAKPAEQTPLVAAEAVRLLRAAGIPPDALQLLPGRGETVGAALVGDARVRAVLFTGSNEVARLLQRSLAGRVDVHGRPATLIAETGGQNAMIVDSSALLEQVVVDVVASAFDSAGQRCSALRVLCLQEDVAERAIEMLVGAMRERRLGATEHFATDVGPVIDEDARAVIEAHIQAMGASGHRVHRPLPLDAAALAHGCFVAPALIELASIGELEREIFGPVLHVVRYRRDQLGALVDAINATGYGLTLGVHTRIDETIETIVGRVRAGNVYVNRNMVGAVVGVQPFGGEGLSGTGPKAGGPLYLHRLVAQPPAWPAEAAGPGPALLGLAEVDTRV
ncbi:MAG: L-glutamate gamma-semialdehyde dehydrogenase, partial [Caldimonas sp.]